MLVNFQTEMEKRQKKIDSENHNFLSPGDSIIERLKSNSPLNEEKPPGPQKDEFGQIKTRSMIGSKDLETEVQKIRNKRAYDAAVLEREARGNRRNTVSRG